MQGTKYGKTYPMSCQGKEANTSISKHVIDAKASLECRDRKIILNIHKFIELQTKTLDQQCKSNDCKIREDKKEPAILRMAV